MGFCLSQLHLQRGKVNNSTKERKRSIRLRYRNVALEKVLFILKDAGKEREKRKNKNKKHL